MTRGLALPAAMGLLIGVVTACSSSAADLATTTASIPSSAAGVVGSGSASVSASSLTTSTTSSAAPTETTPTDTTPTFTPPADAAPVDGDCPYLNMDQVGEATGQRVGAMQVRPATPQPVCEFVRSDGGWLATVRVLQFGTAAEATAAVDFYAPIDTSNPQTKPAGWSGGSQPAAHGGEKGTVYAVSKGPFAVIALCNQPKSVYSRELVIAAIGNLGL